MVPLRPLVDQRGAFGRALPAQRRIDVAAFQPTPRNGVCCSGAGHTCFSAWESQAKPPPAFQLQVRRAHVVQPANPD